MTSPFRSRIGAAIGKGAFSFGAAALAASEDLLCRAMSADGVTTSRYLMAQTSFYRLAV